VNPYNHKGIRVRSGKKLQRRKVWNLEFSQVQGRILGFPELMHCLAAGYVLPGANVEKGELRGCEEKC